MVTDHISDFIIRIKNAGSVGKETVDMPFSKMNHAIAKVLQAEQFIASVKEQGEGVKKKIVVELAYAENGAHKVHDVARVSKPGRRVYAGAKELQKFKKGHGRVILSTPKGILTGEKAKAELVGGEVLFTIW